MSQGEGSLDRAFHIGCPGERLLNEVDISRSPVVSTFSEPYSTDFRQLRETKWT
jgi:hypothetical protein